MIEPFFLPRGPATRWPPRNKPELAPHDQNLRSSSFILRSARARSNSRPCALELDALPPAPLTHCKYARVNAPTHCTLILSRAQQMRRRSHDIIFPSDGIFFSKKIFFFKKKFFFLKKQNPIQKYWFSGFLFFFVFFFRKKSQH